MNFLSYLNLIAANDEVFKNNINNLNPIKSIVSKIMYFNVFQMQEININNGSNGSRLAIANLTQINEIILRNETLIIKNTNLVNNLLKNPKGIFKSHLKIFLFYLK